VDANGRRAGETEFVPPLRGVSGGRGWNCGATMGTGTRTCGGPGERGFVPPLEARAGRTGAQMAEALPRRGTTSTTGTARGGRPGRPGSCPPPLAHEAGEGEEGCYDEPPGRVRRGLPAMEAGFVPPLAGGRPRVPLDEG
jgi:hypothetical protein